MPDSGSQVQISYLDEKKSVHRHRRLDASFGSGAWSRRKNLTSLAGRRDSASLPRTSLHCILQCGLHISCLCQWMETFCDYYCSLKFGTKISILDVTKSKSWIHNSMSVIDTCFGNVNMPIKLCWTELIRPGKDALWLASSHMTGSYPSLFSGSPAPVVTSSLPMNGRGGWGV